MVEPLIWTLVSFINQSIGSNGPDTLGALNPNNLALHRSFRQQFSLHLLIFTAAWLQVLRLRAQRSDFEARIVVAAGLALTLLALLFLVAPFRIMRHNEAERVALGSERRYLVGQRGNDGLAVLSDAAAAVEPHRASRRSATEARRNSRKHVQGG